MKYAVSFAAALVAAGMVVSPALADGLVKDLTGTVKSTVNGVTGNNGNGNSGTLGNTVRGLTGNGNGNGNGNGSLSNTVGDITGGSGNGTSAGNGTSTGAIGSFSDFLSNLNAGNLDNTTGDITGAKDVRVVDVADAFKDFNASALNNALSNNSTQIANLRNALNGNSAAENLLNGNNVDVSHVIGIQNNPDTSVTIYTDGNH